MDITSKLSLWIQETLTNWEVSPEWIVYIKLIFLSFIVALIIYISLYITKKIVDSILLKASNLSHMTFFKYLFENRLPHYLGLLLPYIIISITLPIILSDFPKSISPISKVADIYLVIIVISILMSVIKSGSDVLSEKPAFKDKPMKSYLQVIKMILSLFGTVVIFSILTGKSAATFFAAMGAASAVLLLMFKDSIMGFVASIQVSTNDTVRIGDWITMPKYGADGDVIDITLNTVKVQNFDKTITTIPTYALISDSFQNWRGMQSSGGRRIKRSITIKQASIRYISDEELPDFKRIQGISQYIDERQAEINEHNERIGADRSIPVNGRNMTNSGLFRKYIEWYLQNHPGTNKKMTLMVRQLPPTETGLPFELYVFTNTTNWIQYEYIMADIFDHLIAAVQYFDLQIFEREAGNDIRHIDVQKH